MRTFASQAEGVQHLVIDRLDDLSQTGQKAPQGFGPALPSATLMRRGDQINLVLLLPLTSGPLTCKAFSGQIGPLGRQTSTGQAWRRGLPRSKQGRSQVLIMRTCAGKAKAGNHSLGGHAQQEMEAFIPTDAITPADICLACQPT